MELAQGAERRSGGYRSILKSTSLIGAASILNILIGMVRTKFVAVLLGPSGVGLLGTLGQLTTLVGNLTGLGIGKSGVRQVAEAVGSNDQERIARTVITLRRSAWLTGALGFLVMSAGALPLSRLTFGSDDYAWSIAVLGLSPLAGAIAAGQGCIINGSRRIADLAKISVFGALNGTLISIPCFYFWGQAGVVPSLVLSALAALATSWCFARRVPVQALALPWRDSLGEARQLLLLGLSFMGAGLAASLSGYLIRILMLRQFSLAEVGIYQAAFNLSGLLVGFVLGSMGADYYPRLTAVAGDDRSVQRMINEQTQISVLLALPGLAAMMVFAPLIIELFYAPSFAAAVPVLRWCILGVMGRVFSWPIGFLMPAKGRGKIYFGAELFAALVHVAALVLCTALMGLNGSGVAFLVLYLLYTGLMLFFMHRLVGATWSPATLRLILLAAATLALLMINCSLNGHALSAWGVNLVLLAGATWFCISRLLQHSGLGLKALWGRVRPKKGETGADDK